MSSHKKFGGDWNLPAVERKDGSIETAATATISVAQLILIRDIMKEIRDGINTIRHFFHAIGQERLRLIVQEEGYRAAKKRSDRLSKKRRERKAVPA